MEHIIDIHQTDRIYHRYSMNLIASMGIKEVGQKLVQSKTAPIYIKDISVGGLSFITLLDLPVRSDVILQFDTQLFGRLSGYIVWKKKLKSNFQYGVKFTTVETRLYRLLDYFGKTNTQEKSLI